MSGTVFTLLGCRSRQRRVHLKKTGATKDNVVEVSHEDALAETIRRLEERGFEPLLIAFGNSAGDVEVLTRKISLADFARWLVDWWIPNSYDRTREEGPGH